MIVRACLGAGAEGGVMCSKLGSAVGVAVEVG